MSLTFYFTLAALNNSQRAQTENIETLRQEFAAAWQAKETDIRTVSGVDILHVGHFAILAKAQDEKTKETLKDVLGQDWMILPPVPPAILL